MTHPASLHIHHAPVHTPTFHVGDYHFPHADPVVLAPTPGPHLGDYHFSHGGDFSTAFDPPHLDIFTRVQLGADLGSGQFHGLHHVATALEVAHTAYETGAQMAEDIHTGRNTTEAIVCNVVRGTAMLGVRTIGGAGIALGAGAWAAESAVNPGMLLATPALVRMVGEADHGVEQAAQRAGAAVDSECHALFEISRHLTQRR